MRKGFRCYSGIYCTLLLVFVLLFCCSSTGYANYVLDPDFGSGGLVRTDFPSADGDYAHSLAIDSQGRLVLAGYSKSGTDEDFAIARYKKNGDLDDTFGTGGIVSTDFGTGTDVAYSLAIDSDGKLVVAGSSGGHPNNYFALARYDKNGILDSTFGTGGIVSTDFGTGDDVASSLAIDDQGRLVVAGGSRDGTDEDFALARYDKNGILDSTFGIGGKITTDFGIGDRAFSLAIDSQGRLVVAGYSHSGIDLDFALARYKENGDLDDTFGTGGKITTDFGLGSDVARSLAIDSQGKLVVAGYSHSGTDRDFALARYVENGDLDLSFNGTGKITTDFGFGDAVYSLAIDDQERFVVAGVCNNGTDDDFALARYIEDKKPVKKSSAGGGCNIAYLSVLSILLVVPLMFLSKRER